MAVARPGSATMLTQGALSYAWSAASPMTLAEARYGLERLWSLCGGNGWTGQAVVHIPAVTREDVGPILAGDEAVQWIQPSNFEPAKRSSLSLPALFRPRNVPDPGDFPLDLVALTFVCLSRWDEAREADARDEHGNFDESRQFAVREGFVDRPVVDEWASALAAWVRARTPRWAPSPRSFKVWLTHDIDHIHKFSSIYRIARSGVGAALRNPLKPHQAFGTVVNGVFAYRNYQTDPAFSGIRSLLKWHRQLGTKATFFFMTAEKGTRDVGYRLDSTVGQSILHDILNDGHEIGWHPGYCAAEDDDVFGQEFNKFSGTLGFTPATVRHHYLRWRVGRSWKRLEDFGIKFDSSLGFNGRPGFRCGTCHPFPVFDIATQRQLQLVERPLWLQDTAVSRLSSGWFDEVDKIGSRVDMLGGELTILMHNTFDTDHDSRHTGKLLRELAMRLLSAQR